MNYGLWCGLYLVFNGLCCLVSLIYFRVGKVPSVGIGALIYGGLSLIVSYGVIWRERNSRCFEGKEWSFSDLKYHLLHTLLEWSSSFNLFPYSNFLERFDLCNLCVWCSVFHVHPGVPWLLFNTIPLFIKKKQKKKNSGVTPRIALTGQIFFFNNTSWVVHNMFALFTRYMIRFFHVMQVRKRNIGIIYFNSISINKNLRNKKCFD